MTGVITSLPPVVQQPPGSASSNPAGLPGVTYQAAIPNLPQTWSALQTFLTGDIQFSGSTSGNTLLNATAIASGTVLLPAVGIGITDTLVGRNTTDTLTNKTFTSPTINTPTITGATITTSTYNGNTWTAGTGTLTIATGKTETFNNTLTFAGTDGTTLTFQGTDTYVGRATTDTLTNKTFDTAGTGNSFKINGTAITVVTGTGSAVLATSPTLVTPVLGTPTSGTLTNCMGLPLSGLATQAAFTLLGNNTSGSASPTAFTIDGLTLKASPAAGDETLIWDVAGSAWKKATVSGIGAAAGVSSIAGNTGAFTLSHGLTNSTNDLQIDIATQRGHIAGLVLSTAGSSTTYSVSVGVAVDSTNADFMKLTSAYSKTTAAWAVGSATGSLDTGAIAASTWYHVYLIKRPDTGVVDVAISLSASAPTTGGTIPAAYTLFRRIGAMKTDGSSNWIAFNQNGDEFIWLALPIDVNAAALSNTAVLYTLSIPTGVKVLANYLYDVTATNTLVGVVFTPPDMNDTPAGSGLINAGVAVGASSQSQRSFGMLTTRSNTSGQIRARGFSSGITVSVTTFGWIDTRGRFA